MMNTSTPDFHSWPKIDLHRHLAGSIRMDTWLDLIPEDHPAHKLSREEIIQEITITEPGDLNSYLTRFRWLDQCLTNEAALERVSYEAAADAAADGQIYVEFRFSPARFTLTTGLPISDILKAIISGRHQAERDYPIKVGLIAGLSREMGYERCQQTAREIIRFAGSGIAGIDLLGEERDYPPEIFSPIFLPLAEEGSLGITIHAGEDSAAENVRDAILMLGAQRIGHGIRAIDSQEVMALLMDREVTVETCPTSNLHTRAVATFAEHPLPVFLSHGVRGTINTDNPNVSLTTLTHEYEIAYQQMSLSLADLARTTVYAAEAIFTPAYTRQAVISDVKKKLAAYLPDQPLD